MITCSNNQIENKEYPSWTAARSKLVGKICVFNSYSPVQLFNIYILDTLDTLFSVDGGTFVIKVRQCFFSKNIFKLTTSSVLGKYLFMNCLDKIHKNIQK